MQKIKFRAWDKLYKKMIVDEQDYIPLKVTNKGILRLNPNHEANFWEFVDEDRFELMQFTGLYDDAGKEIYEGDIVEIQDKGETKTSYISKVYMYHDGVTVKHHPTHEALGHTGLRLLSHYCDYGCGDEYKGRYCKCKIVGNVCENKDLLEDEC